MQDMKQGCVGFTSGLLPGAEKELAAYMFAVQELFGSEHAREAADVWIEELELLDWPAGDGDPAWRRITIAAAIRLARRLNPAEFNETAKFFRFLYQGASTGEKEDVYGAN